MGDRHQFRANWHDYNGGTYFVTICCHKKKHFFGKIIDDKMYKNHLGTLAEASLLNIPSHFPDSEIWNLVVMPNHVHFIISIKRTSSAEASLTQNLPTPNRSEALTPAEKLNTQNSEHKHYLGCLKPKKHGAPDVQDYHHNSRLAVIVGQFKSTVTRGAKTLNPTFKWQERFHENVIRSDHSYHLIMNYISTNVENWCFDRFNPDKIDDKEAPWHKLNP